MNSHLFKCFASLMVFLCATLPSNLVLGEEIKPPAGQPSDPTAWYAVKPHCGFTMTDVAMVKEKLSGSLLRNFSTRKGAMVIDLMAGSTAEAAKFQVLDIITHLNMKPVANTEEAIQIISTLDVGSEVKCKIQRPSQHGNRVLWNAVSGTFIVGTYFENCKNALQASQDSFSGIERIQHRSDKDHVTESFASLKIVVGKTATPALFLKLQYTGHDDWLFVQQAEIANHGRNLKFIFSDPTRDNQHIGGAHCLWEYQSFPISDFDEWRELLRFNETIPVRYQGNDYHADEQITEEMVLQMRTMFDYYAMLTGKETIFRP